MVKIQAPGMGGPVIGVQEPRDVPKPPGALAAAMAVAFPDGELGIVREPPPAAGGWKPGREDLLEAKVRMVVPPLWDRGVKPDAPVTATIDASVKTLQPVSPDGYHLAIVAATDALYRSVSSDTREALGRDPMLVQREYQ